MARKASMSAGKLSKIETNKVRPTVQDVDLILSALGVSAEAKEQFLDAARVEATEATAWRLLRRMGPWKHQNTIKAVEAGTKTLRLFQGQLVPGLLQTPEYASAVFSVPPALPDETKARTVAARLARQETLHDPERSFHFLICEHVLRWRVPSPTVLALQLDRIISLSRLPNVDIGVLPLDAPMPDFPMTCFSLHDDRLVIAETFHSEITTTEQKDVQIYLDTFERFAEVALHGDEMKAFVEAIRDGFLPHEGTG